MKFEILICFKDFLFFNNYTKKNKFTYLDFLVLILFKISILILVSFFIFYMGLDKFERSIGQDDTTHIKLFLNAIILVPVIEEIIFRYHQKLSFKGIILSTIFAVLLFYSSLWLLLFFGLYMGGLLVAINLNTPPPRIVIVFLSSVIFALFHLDNFNNIDYLHEFYFIPILIFSQFISGLILSFIFWNFGLKYSVFFHMIWNAIFILPKILYEIF